MDAEVDGSAEDADAAADPETEAAVAVGNDSEALTLCARSREYAASMSKWNGSCQLPYRCNADSVGV
jgi:hypothetical protein